MCRKSLYRKLIPLWHNYYLGLNKHRFGEYHLYHQLLLKVKTLLSKLDVVQGLILSATIFLMFLEMQHKVLTMTSTPSTTHSAWRGMKEHSSTINTYWNQMSDLNKQTYPIHILICHFHQLYYQTCILQSRQGHIQAVHRQEHIQDAQCKMQELQRSHLQIHPRYPQ